MEGSLDGLLSALEERANTARTIFMLLDSDADGLVAVEQVSPRGGKNGAAQAGGGRVGAWRHGRGGGAGGGASLRSGGGGG